MYNCYTIKNEMIHNGIACPKCGEELYDKHPDYILTCNPPKKEVICKKCNYLGYRYC
jgi:hypothetical protein